MKDRVRPFGNAAIRMASMGSRLLRTRKAISLVVLLVVIAALSLFTSVPLLPHFGKPAKVVIVLGANKGGGVLQWKSAKDWDIEKISIANKKDYAKRHGYQLVVKDMTARRKYSQEWREGWQKVDILKDAMRQFPKAEWFWWVDLNTYIMEPQKSLDQLLFSKLDDLERDCYSYNPANLNLDLPFVDYNVPISMILSQDCSGFSLGS